jgi:hypothetical protein
MLLTVMCSSTAHAEGIVTFLRQKWLRGRATTLRSTFVAYLYYFGAQQYGKPGFRRVSFAGQQHENHVVFVCSKKYS